MDIEVRETSAEAYCSCGSVITTSRAHEHESMSYKVQMNHYQHRYNRRNDPVQLRLF